MKKSASDPVQVDAGKTSRLAVAVQAGGDEGDPGGSQAPRLTATVCDPSGAPVAHAKVQILARGGAPVEVVAGDDGRFAVNPVLVGPFFCFLMARHPERNLLALSMLENGKKPSPVRLLPPVKVSGVVRDTQGKAIAAAGVSAQIDASHLGALGTVASVQADKDGRYEMELPAHDSISYAISASAPGYTVTEMLLREGRLTPGADAKRDLVLQTADRVVRGVTKDEQGNPVAGVVVTARATGGPDFPDSAVTDEEGRFTLEHLNNVRGIYLFAKAPGRGWIGNTTIDPDQTNVAIELGPSRWD